MEENLITYWFILLRKEWYGLSINNFWAEISVSSFTRNLLHERKFNGLDEKRLFGTWAYFASFILFGKSVTEKRNSKIKYLNQNCFITCFNGNGKLLFSNAISLDSLVCLCRLLSTACTHRLCLSPLFQHLLTYTLVLCPKTKNKNTSTTLYIDKQKTHSL